MRAAGGWVRDKLLGLENSLDVDVAVDRGTGVEFAMKVREYFQLRNSGKEERMSQVGYVFNVH